MKSFSQFLQESYLSEEEAVQGSLLTRKGKPQDFRNPNRIPFTATDPTPVPTSRRLPASSTTSAPTTSPGQLEIPQGKTTKVKSPASPAQLSAPNYRPGAGRSPQPYSGTTSPAGKVEPVGTRYSQQTGSPQPRTRGGDLALRPQGSSNIVSPSTSSTGKPPAGPKIKVPAGAGKALRVAGKVLGPAAAALDVADERAKGSGWLRSGLKAAVVGGAGALGAAAGAPLTPVGSLAAGTGAAIAASKAFDVAAGANAVQRKAMATANRRAQSGGALSGIGGKTTFDTKKGTMTTGVGSQQRTVKLGKTSVVTDPKTGKQDVGYLAYKGGKAVYKRADTKNLAQTSSNPLERIGRSLFAGAYKQSDAAAAAKKLAAARQSDVARQKALGVKMKPGG